MSRSVLVRGIVRRLETAGYISVATPFRAASVDFDFTAALHGRAGRSLDLILIVDTATGDHGDRDAASVRQRIQALSRALDVTKSRYVLTVILAGASLAKLVDSLSPICRVLIVDTADLNPDGTPIGSEARDALDDQIRLLLPLEIQPNDGMAQAVAIDPIAELVAVLPEGVDERLIELIAVASARGDAAVTRALGNRVDEVLAMGTSA